MKLTDEQITAIRDGAEGVTPGPWRRYPKSPHVARDTALPDPHPNVGSVLVAECGNYRDKELVPFNMDRWLADAAHIARCDPDTIRAAMDEIAESRAEIERWRSNSRETFDAMVSMRNDINEHIPLPSLESDLSQGPDNSVFCAVVAQGVVTALAAKDAEIERLTKELQSLALDALTAHGQADDNHARAIAAEAQVKALRNAVGPVVDAVHGLSFGEDWNNGTHAKAHGYRAKLLAALPSARAALGRDA